MISHPGIEPRVVAHKIVESVAHTKTTRLPRRSSSSQPSSHPPVNLCYIRTPRSRTSRVAARRSRLGVSGRANRRAAASMVWVVFFIVHKCAFFHTVSFFLYRNVLFLYISVLFLIHFTVYPTIPAEIAQYRWGLKLRGTMSVGSIELVGRSARRLSRRS